MARHRLLAAFCVATPRRLATRAHVPNPRLRLSPRRRQARVAMTAKKARSEMRVRELEVRAGARSAALAAEASDEELSALEAAANAGLDDKPPAPPPVAPRDAAQAILDRIDKELRALAKIEDPRLAARLDELHVLRDRATEVMIRAEIAASAAAATLPEKADAVDAPAQPASSATAPAAQKIARGVRRSGVALVRRAESVRSGVGSRVAEYVRDDGSIDFKGLRALLGGAVDSAGGVWARLNGRELPAPNGLTPTFAPLADEDKMFRLRNAISELERRLQAESKRRESVLRREDQLGKLMRAKEIRAMDDSVSAVRRMLAVRVLQLEMEKIFAALADEVARSSLLGEQRLMIAEFGDLDARLLELLVFIDSDEPMLIADDALGEVAADIQYLKQRLGLDATLYTSATLDWMQVRQMMAVGVQKTRAGLEFYGRGFRLFVGDLSYAARLVRRVVWGYTPTPREVRTLRRTGRDLVTLVPFTIILILPLTPVGHVLIFGFIQRNWPDFFPSTFSERRQALMKRYENFEREMRDGDEEGGADAAAAPKRGGLLRRAARFWRGPDPQPPYVEKTDTFDVQSTDAPAAREATQAEAQQAVAATTTTADYADGHKAESNGVAKSRTHALRKKSMEIDELHLAD